MVTKTVQVEIEFGLHELLEEMSYDEAIKQIVWADENISDYSFTLKLLIEIIKEAILPFTQEIKEADNIDNKLISEFVEQVNMIHNAFSKQKTLEINQNIDTISGNFVGVTIDRVG